jgi:hypothetical protein
MRADASSGDIYAHVHRASGFQGCDHVRLLNNGISLLRKAGGDDRPARTGARRPSVAVHDA